MLSSVMRGPWPLSSVSSLDLIFALMRVKPSSTCTRSWSMPEAASSDSSAMPVKPAEKPSAREA